jgi:hypothetical protein
MTSPIKTSWVFVFAFTWWGAVGGAGLWVMAWAEGTTLPFLKLVGAGIGIAWFFLTALYMEDKKRRRGGRSKEAAQVIPINRARRRKC